VRRQRRPEIDPSDDPSSVAQRLLLETWRQGRHLGAPPPALTEVGFSCFSANDEDGILLGLFDRIGTTNRVLLDIGCGVPEGANSTNLLVHWAWTGVLIDADAASLERTGQWYADQRLVPWPPTLIEARVAPESIDALLSKRALTGTVDLLLLDIDSVDLWLWHDLTVVHPRVVVVEYSHFWGPHRAVSVPRDWAGAGHVDPLYCSASLEAYVRVGRRKGYRLVAVNNRRFNAFFVHEDAAGDLPELTPEQAFANPPIPGTGTSWSADGLPGRWVEVD
jgi:hypothetical protein